MEDLKNKRFFSIIGLMCSCTMKMTGASLYRIQ